MKFKHEKSCLAFNCSAGGKGNPSTTPQSNYFGLNKFVYLYFRYWVLFSCRLPPSGHKLTRLFVGEEEAAAAIVGVSGDAVFAVASRAVDDEYVREDKRDFIGLAALTDKIDKGSGVSASQAVMGQIALKTGARLQTSIFAYLEAAVNLGAGANVGPNQD